MIAKPYPTRHRSGPQNHQSTSPRDGTTCLRWQIPVRLTPCLLVHHGLRFFSAPSKEKTGWVWRIIAKAKPFSQLAGPQNHQSTSPRDGTTCLRWQIPVRFTPFFFVHPGLRFFSAPSKGKIVLGWAYDCKAIPHPPPIRAPKSSVNLPKGWYNMPEVADPSPAHSLFVGTPRTPVFFSSLKGKNRLGLAYYCKSKTLQSTCRAPKSSVNLPKGWYNMPEVADPSPVHSLFFCTPRTPVFFSSLKGKNRAGLGV